MSPSSSLAPVGGGGKNTVSNKEPRPVACTNCHSSKVRCEKSFPCKRCVRLKMEDKCLPHNSQQGRGTKKRRRDKDVDGSRGTTNEEEEKTKTKVPLVGKESTWIWKSKSLSNIFKKQTGGIRLKVSTRRTPL